MMASLKSAIVSNRLSRRLLTVLMLCGLLMAPSAQAQSGTSQLVTGAACFIVTPVYGAFKLAFAGVGSVVGGLTWIFTGGDYYSAKKVWDASQKGTYIITPEHLSGQKPIEFVGPTRP